MTSPLLPRPRTAGARWVAGLLGGLLVPVVVLGFPAWVVLGVLCAMPFVGVVAIPLLISLSFALLYSTAWLSYLLLAQSDPPPPSNASDGTPAKPTLFSRLTAPLPFLPLSPSRCFKVDWAAFRYVATAWQIIFPAGLDWSYRRVMILGGKQGKEIVKENLPYGPSGRQKFLDVYIPRSPSTAANTPSTSQFSTKPPFPAPSHSTRRHSTTMLFSPPSSPQLGAQDGLPLPPTTLAPIVVIVPSALPPLPTSSRKVYLQLALRFRRMGYAVVVPDITTWPTGRVKESVEDLRRVLEWVGREAGKFGGDVEKIHVFGHGLSAHLVLLTLLQEAVVRSRDAHLESAYRLARERELTEMRDVLASSSFSAANNDTPAGVDAESGGVPFPSGTSAEVDAEKEETIKAWRAAHVKGGGATGPPWLSGRGDVVETAEGEISNGLRKVEIYDAEAEVPRVAGVILLAPVTDVIKAFRFETQRGVEHLSILRRLMGPSHTACLLHSPAHLLYASKNIIDLTLLPPKFLFIHGGRDEVVPIEQSNMMRTLLHGVGVEYVKLRAYRELFHTEALACLFLGMGKSQQRYQGKILSDIANFISL